jgi:hypothetical protein
MSGERKEYLREWIKKKKTKVNRRCENCGKQIYPDAKYCGSCKQVGERNNNWLGGVNFNSQGYKRIKLPGHPLANGDGYVFEHRLVMEAHIGRTLLPSEIVHHINGDRLDNRIENLMLFPGHRQHAICHGLGKTNRGKK